MIQANCRARFTAADFDFVVRSLARSQSDRVSLVDLLSDNETRDAVLDSPRLVDAILSHAGQLRISSHFYFYVLARHVLREAGITERKVSDYIGSLLEAFSRGHVRAPHENGETAHQYISDMLIALTRATPQQAFLIRAHVGNYSLFISGIFHPAVAGQRRSARGGPNLAFYEQIGSRSYGLVADDPTAKRCELDDVFEGLATQFHHVRVALNHLAEELINIDDDPHTPPFLR